MVRAGGLTAESKPWVMSYTLICGKFIHPAWRLILDQAL